MPKGRVLHHTLKALGFTPASAILNKNSREAFSNWMTRETLNLSVLCYKNKTKALEVPGLIRELASMSTASLLTILTHNSLSKFIFR